jgi:hypothetical protein
MGRPRIGFAALALAIALTSSACLGGGGGSGATRSRPSATATTNGPGCQFIVASEAKRTEPTPIAQPVYLTSASAASTVCYDKITFVFTPGTAVPGVVPTTTTTVPGATTTTTNPETANFPPGYTVQYMNPPFAPKLVTATEQIPSVHAILEVTISPASAVDAQATRHTQTYQGALRLPLSGMAHTDSVEFLSSFPQSPVAPPSVVWLIGLDSKQPFTTDYANSPPRLSVLIMNGAP